MLRRLSIVAFAAVALSGCGNARTPVPDIDHALDPVGEPREYDYKDAGVFFKAPNNWQPVVAVGSLIGGAKSKSAAVNVWRYPREEPLPKTRTELEAARDRLVETVKAKDPMAVFDKQRVTKHGVQLLGSGVISGVPVDFRSTHLFRHGAEVVIDAYAPPEDFDRVDAAVFQPLLKTLKVTKP